MTIALNHGKPWCLTEEALLVSFVKENKSCTAIAESLGRSLYVVKKRVGRLRTPPKTSIVNQNPQEPKPTLRILRGLLPDYYEAGWRVVSFDALTCLLEWPHQTKPNQPRG